MEKRHSRSGGVLIRGEAANAKTGYSPLFFRKGTNRDGDDNNKWACVTYLLDFPPVPSFCFVAVVQSQLRSKGSGFITYLPLLGKSPKKNNAKRAYLFPNSGDSRCTHWPSPSWGKMLPPPAPPPRLPFPFQRVPSLLCRGRACIF